jgi:predicted RNA-binding protein with PUA-like domain
MSEIVHGDRRYFLAKTDPETYSVEQLEREGETIWDGVRNPQALRAIREMKTGDCVFMYHSMGNPAVVGVAEVSTPGRPDPKDPKLAVAGLRFRCRIDPPVTLKEIKASGKFDDWALIRQSRLSTMIAPVSFADWLRGERSGCRF